MLFSEISYDASVALFQSHGTMIQAHVGMSCVFIALTYSICHKCWCVFVIARSVHPCGDMNERMFEIKTPDKW